jgi:hypothetical protein
VNGGSEWGQSTQIHIQPRASDLKRKRSTDGRWAVLAGGAQVAYTGMYAFDAVLRLRPGRFPGAACLLLWHAASWKAAGR